MEKGDGVMVDVEDRMQDEEGCEGYEGVEGMREVWKLSARVLRKALKLVEGLRHIVECLMEAVDGVREGVFMTSSSYATTGLFFHRWHLGFCDMTCGF